MNLNEIKENVLSGKLSGKDAINLLCKSRKPWDTKEWKQRRTEIIGHSCEKCETTENLVIQHNWHPPKIREIYQEIQQENGYEEWIAEKINTIIIDEEEVCPKCGSNAIRYKKDKDAYVCVSNKYDSEKGKRVFCKNVFDKPVMGISNNLRYTKEFEVRKNMSKEFNDVFHIDRKVAIRSIEYSERYRNMLNGDVKTLCKKCAFIEDKENGLIRIQNWPISE